MDAEFAVRRIVSGSALLVGGFGLLATSAVLWPDSMVVIVVGVTGAVLVGVIVLRLRLFAANEGEINRAADAIERTRGMSSVILGIATLAAFLWLPEEWFFVLGAMSAAGMLGLGIRVLRRGLLTRQQRAE